MEQHSSRRKVPERNGDLAINLPIEVGYSNMYIDMWSFSLGSDLAKSRKKEPHRILGPYNFRPIKLVEFRS